MLGAVESGAAGDQELVLRRTIELISGRLDDLLKALAAPGNDERRLFARALLQRKGLRFATVADREAARDYLLAAVIRVASEQDQIDQELGATSGGDPITEFVRRSRLFRTRGLSLDTSLVTNYSVEQALAAMKARGLLAARRRDGAWRSSVPDSTSRTRTSASTSTLNRRCSLLPCSIRSSGWVLRPRRAIRRSCSSTSARGSSIT